MFFQDFKEMSEIAELEKELKVLEKQLETLAKTRKSGRANVAQATGCA